MMRANMIKPDKIIMKMDIDSTNIATYIDAPITPKYPMKHMVVKLNMKGIFEK